ncbi:MAG: class I SAM-dependent methyltransferase [Phyllobacteriaceae bacterium]|nr:class I SAM-dependent methyltransferase [Phyllobacteriaceae bacterium]
MGVDIVQPDPYTIPLETASCDLVISGQMLEHSGQFWRVFSEIRRVLKPSGLAFIIAPSSGPVHRYPVDCYRFFPDAFEACAEWAELRLVHCWHDDRGPWCDLVGVFQNQGTLTARHQPVLRSPVNSNVYNTQNPQHEITKGSRSYLDVLAELHELKTPARYFEIGVRNGHSLALAACPSVAIDPSPNLTAVSDKSRIDLHVCTSDDFFFLRQNRGSHRLIWLLLMGCISVNLFFGIS